MAHEGHGKIAAPSTAAPSKRPAGADNDGSSKFRFLVTPIRIVCANTQTAAIEAAAASWGIRHTGGARVAIQEARTALKLSWRYIQAFEEEAAQLYSSLQLGPTGGSSPLPRCYPNWAVPHSDSLRFHQMNHGCGDSCVGGQLALVTKTVADLGI